MIPSAASAVARSCWLRAIASCASARVRSALAWSRCAWSSVGSITASRSPQTTVSPTLTGMLRTMPETREPTSISAPTLGRMTPVAETVLSSVARRTRTVSTSGSVAAAPARSQKPPATTARKVTPRVRPAHLLRRLPHGLH